MGLMDNIKNAQEMAKQAQEAAAQQMGGNMAAGAGAQPPGGLEYAQWTQNVAQNGLDGEGTITSINETGGQDASGAKEFEVKIDASLGGEAYEATAKQFLHPSSVDAYKVGGKFNLKVDPDDKTRVLLMGGVE
jgi:hypothetical protein